MNQKKKSEIRPDHLGIIKQIGQVEIESNSQIKAARLAFEDRILKAEKEASILIQNEQESARQMRREMVRTEMTAAESNAGVELKDAEKKAEKYLLQGAEFVDQAVSEALKHITLDEDLGK